MAMRPADRGSRTMNELLRHLYKDHLPSLFWDEASQRIEYGEFTRHVYMMIARALNEGADRIQVSASSLMWSREGEIIGKVDHKPPDFPGYPKNSYVGAMRKIIENDPIMRKWNKNCERCGR
jgi:hypothetical protein